MLHFRHLTDVHSFGYLHLNPCFFARGKFLQGGGVYFPPKQFHETLSTPKNFQIFVKFCKVVAYIFPPNNSTRRSVHQRTSTYWSEVTGWQVEARDRYMPDVIAISFRDHGGYAGIYSDQKNSELLLDMMPSG